MIDYSPTAWSQVLSALRPHPTGTVVRLPKHWLPHPADAGARRSVGLPLGQTADFRWKLGDCAGLHVRDFGGHYEAHIDSVDPACGLVEHLRRDAPQIYVGGAVAVGALAGVLLGKSKEAAIVGAGLGALVGAVTQRRSKP